MSVILQEMASINSILQEYQPVFTCLKSTVETPNNVWNRFKVTNKDEKIKSLTSFWYLFYLLRRDFAYCSGIFLVNFKQVNAP